MINICHRLVPDQIKAAYRKQEFIDNMINWGVGLLCFAMGGMILVIAVWIVGKARGRW